MDLQGIYSTRETTNYSAKSVDNSKTTAEDKTVNKAINSEKAAYSEISATYEGSAEVFTKGITDRAAIVEQMKADAETRFNQMQSLVTQMFQKQGITIGTADEMWKVLASGDFEADPDTIAKAKEDISEDGYWGVKQTSERIFSFALALSGGDDKKMQEMVKAVEEGFGEATKIWGKELPDITKDTHSSIMDKFDKWFEENGSTATTEALLNS